MDKPKLQLTCGNCGAVQSPNGENLFAMASGGWDGTLMEFEIIFDCDNCNVTESVAENT